MTPDEQIKRWSEAYLKADFDRLKAEEECRRLRAALQEIDANTGKDSVPGGIARAALAKTGGDNS